MDIAAVAESRTVAGQSQKCGGPNDECLTVPQGKD